LGVNPGQVLFFCLQGGSIQPVFSHIGRGNISTVLKIGGIEMEVQRIENFKIPNAVTHEITQEELQRDFDYYRAQKVLETMFMFGMISVGEFHKISAVNRKTFSPFLAEIMG
jgi:hypothetical protein